MFWRPEGLAWPAGLAAWPLDQKIFSAGVYTRITIFVIFWRPEGLPGQLFWPPGQAPCPARQLAGLIGRWARLFCEFRIIEIFWDQIYFSAGVYTRNTVFVMFWRLAVWAGQAGRSCVVCGYPWASS